MTPTEERTPEFQDYWSVIDQSIGRNLDQSVSFEKPVTIKFFLTSNGFIYDVSVNKSSGDQQADSACIDAVCSASPLPKPPRLRLEPPPKVGGGDFVPPRYFGTGVYYYNFPVQDRGKAPESLGFKLIPSEIKYRYPGLFSDDYLNSAANKVTYPKQELIEDIRFQWANFFETNKTASKEVVDAFAKNIQKFYLSEKTAAHY